MQREKETRRRELTTQPCWPCWLQLHFLSLCLSLCFPFVPILFILFPCFSFLQGNLTLTFSTLLPYPSDPPRLGFWLSKLGREYLFLSPRFSCRRLHPLLSIWTGFFPFLSLLILFLFLPFSFYFSRVVDILVLDLPIHVLPTPISRPFLSRLCQERLPLRRPSKTSSPPPVSSSAISHLFFPSSLSPRRGQGV